MNRTQLTQLEDNFKAFVAPLLDGNDPQDYHFIWEFQKFFHGKKLEVLTAESQGVKKWKELLLRK
jgi:hypothetical protein